MHKLATVIFTLLIRLLLQGQSAGSQDQLNDLTVKQKLDDLLSAFAAVNLFNGSAFVAQNGQILLSKGYGFADYVTGKRNTDKSMFRIYSITKPITATVILKLIQEKKLSLDDKLSKFYPGLPSADSISVKNLLTHTSGIYGFNNDGSMPYDSEENMIAFLEKTPLQFPAGTAWRYSNTGYFLLGFIIQKITDMKYEAVVDKYIFKPLQMSSSGFNYAALSSENKTTGYTFLYKDSVRVSGIHDEKELFSSGAMYATTADLYKYHLAMQNHIIINKELTEQAYTPFKKNYGYGWIVDSLPGKRLIHHSGGAMGFRSELMRVDNDNICIVLLSNCENSDLEFLKKNILAVLYGEPVKVPFTVALSASNLNKLAGAYNFKPDFTIYITRENNRLMAQPSRQSKQQILPETTNCCYVPSIQGYLEFKSNANNVFDSLVLFQKGERFIGKRVNASWGITGTVKESGWNGPDIELVENSNAPGLWLAHNILLKKGALKFRFNNDWTFSYGDNNGDGLAESAGENIKVEHGRYNITLDLRDVENVRYIIYLLDK